MKVDLSLTKIAKNINDDITFRYNFISEFLLIHKIITSNRIKYLMYFTIIMVVLVAGSFSMYNKAKQYKKEITVELEQKNIELETYIQDNTMLQTLIKNSGNDYKKIKQNINTNLYFTNIFDTFGRFYNYLVMNLEILRIPFTISYLNSSDTGEIKGESSLYTEYMINNKYKSNFKSIPMELMVSFAKLGITKINDNQNKKQNTNLLSIDSTIFLSRISSLLTLFVVDLQNIKYDNNHNVYTIKFSILGL